VDSRHEKVEIPAAQGRGHVHGVLTSTMAASSWLNTAACPAAPESHLRHSLSASSLQAVLSAISSHALLSCAALLAALRTRRRCASGILPLRAAMLVLDLRSWVLLVTLATISPC